MLKGQAKGMGKGAYYGGSENKSHYEKFTMKKKGPIDQRTILKP